MRCSLYKLKKQDWAFIPDRSCQTDHRYDMYCIVSILQINSTASQLTENINCKKKVYLQVLMQNKPAIPALKVGSFHVPHNMKHGVELGCKEACRHGAIVGKLKLKVKVNVSHEIQVLVEWWARTLEQWPAYANAIVSLFILNFESLSIDKPKKKRSIFAVFNQR